MVSPRMANALLAGLAALGAHPAEAKAGKPERPERPHGKAANTTELKEIIKNFQDQKKQFLNQQKDQQADSRARVREELGGGSVQDAKDSIAEAKRVSREQARKIAEE